MSEEAAAQGTSIMPDPSLPTLPSFSLALDRRRWLLGAATLLATGGRAVAALPSTATLLVAGPSQGDTAAWADLIAPPLAQAFPPGIHLERENVGGADGVTGANQFEARTAPDGGTALLLPGAAATAWLVGDPRAKFNMTQWVTALAGTTPTVLASRLPLADLTAGRIVRVAGDPAGAALPALLTLELMGALPQAVPLRPGYAGADAAVLHGRDVVAQISAAVQLGLKPVLTLRERDPANGPAGRDPDFPDLPFPAERITPGLRRPLAAALGAVVAASRLDTVLALPPLTSSGMVALWRRACTQAAAAPATQTAAARLGIRAEAEAAAVASTAPLAVDAAALLDLRQWLAQRFGWRPS